MSGLSVKIPFVIDDVDGAYALNKNYLDLVRQNLKMLLLTNPGERIMDMNFGVGLYHVLFEQNTSFEKEEIKGNIVSQVGRYLPYITINNVMIEDIAEGNGIHVSIAYTVEPLSMSDLLDIEFE